MDVGGSAIGNQRQGLIKIDVDIAHQRFDALHQTGIDGLKTLRMCNQILYKEMQKLAIRS